MTMTKIWRRPTWMVLVALAAIGLVDGCTCSDEPQAPTQAAKPAPEEPPTAAPPARAPKPRPQSVREQLETTVDLVPSWPKDAPVYPGANVSDSQMRNGKVNAVFSTEDSADQVKSWMQDFLQREGWDAMPPTDMDNGTLIQAFKGRRALSTVISEVDNGDLTMIVVAASP